jgi:hypothetical protein
MPYQSHPPSSDHCHKFWRVVLLAAEPEQYCRCRVSKPQIPASRWGGGTWPVPSYCSTCVGFPPLSLLAARQGSACNSGTSLNWRLSRSVFASIMSVVWDRLPIKLFVTPLSLLFIVFYCCLALQVNLALKYLIFFCHGSWILLKSVAFELSRNYLLQFVATYLVQQSFFPRYFARILAYCHNLVHTIYIFPFASYLLLFRPVVPRSDSFVNYKFRHVSARVNYVHQQQVFRNWVWG